MSREKDFWEPDYDFSRDEIEGMAKYHCEEQHRKHSPEICTVCGQSTQESEKGKRKMTILDQLKPMKSKRQVINLGDIEDDLYRFWVMEAIDRRVPTSTLIKEVLRMIMNEKLKERTSP